MKTPILISFISLFCSCASVSIKGPAYVVQNDKGGSRLEAPTIYKASGINRLPMQDVEITRDRVSIVEHMPEGGWPVERHTRWLKDGTPVVDEMPVYASNASDTTNAIHNLWSGVAKMAIGTAGSVWTALGLGAQATSAQIASTNANAKVTNTTTLSNASVEKARIAADVTKTLGR